MQIYLFFILYMPLKISESKKLDSIYYILIKNSVIIIFEKSKYTYFHLIFKALKKFQITKIRINLYYFNKNLNEFEKANSPLFKKFLNIKNLVLYFKKKKIGSNKY